MKNLMAYRPRRPLALGCLLFIILMYVLLWITPDRPDPVPCDDGGTACVTGRVIRRETQKKPDGTVRRILYLKVSSDRGHYELQCYVPEGEKEVCVGETVRVSGTFRAFSEPTNPGEFDSLFYYRVQGISGRLTGTGILASDGRCDMPREMLSRLRERFAASLDACLDAEDAGILRAMLLGDKSGMDPEIKELYQRSGIIHILAISGLHISLIGMGIFGILVRLRIKRSISAGISVLVMLCYGEICGQTSPATRALIMFLMRLLAMMTGRCYDILTALALAAVLLVVEQPLYLLYSGFLLSFLAVLAVAVVRPALTPARLLKRFPSRGDPPWMGAVLKLSDGLFSSLSVSVTTLPVYMLSFHTFSVYSVFLNILIIPLVPVVVGAGILCMLAGLLCTPAGQAAGGIDHIFLAAFQMLCRAENALPGAVWVTGHAQPWQIGLYTVMLAAYVAAVYFVREREKAVKKQAQGQKKRAKGQRRREQEQTKRLKGQMSRLLSCAAVLWLFLAVLLVSLRTSPELKITFLDVGQGDGIVLTCAGRHLLIDGGSSSRTGVGGYVLEPFLEYEGIRTIDAAILTHEDDDHINGLTEILEDETSPIRIRALCLPLTDPSSRGENYGKLLNAAQEKKIPVTFLKAGDELLRGDISIVCLGPPAHLSGEEPNEHSVVLYLTYGQFSAMFTGDLEGAGEEALMRLLGDNPRTARDLTLLKVAHHGSRFTTCESFLERVKPRIAVISCGRNNRYGHPHAELLERIRMRGISSFITAERGAVTAEISDAGRNMRMRGFLDE